MVEVDGITGWGLHWHEDHLTRMEQAGLEWPTVVVPLVKHVFRWPKPEGWRMVWLGTEELASGCNDYYAVFEPPWNRRPKMAVVCRCEFGDPPPTVVLLLVDWDRVPASIYAQIVQLMGWVLVDGKGVHQPPNRWLVRNLG